MRTVINLISLLLISGVALAQTTVGGPVFSNAHWLASGSPYQVTSNVQLPPGVTLTIDPGCVINFTGEYELLVKGAIIAEGTSALPIKITGTTSQFRPVFMLRGNNLSNCKLSYLEMTGKKIAVQVGEFGDTVLNSGVLALSHVNITNGRILTMGSGSGASVTIENSLFSGADVLSYHQTQSEPISISNCTFSASQIGAGSLHGPVTLTNCSIQGSTLNTTYGSLKLQDCKINASHCGGDGDIIACELNNTTVWMGNVNFSDCVINSGNTYGVIMKSGVIECTKLTGSGQGTGIEFGNGGQASLYKSAITGYSVGIWARNMSSFICDSANIFNNTAYNLMTHLHGNISLSNVYWGSTDSATIASKVYDYYDNINYGRCYFPSPRSTQYHSPSCAVTLTVSQIATDISEFVQAKSLLVYPSPAGSFVSLRSSGYLHGTAEITGVDGRIIKRLQINDAYMLLDVSDLPAGLYLVKIQNPGFAASGRFIKE